MKSASADGRIQVLDRGRYLARHVRQQLHDVLGAPLHQAHARLDVGRHDLGDADFLDARDQKRKSVEVLDDAESAHALRDHMMGAVRGGDIAQHLRGGAHGMQLIGSRFLDRRVLLQDDPERAFGADRLLGSRDGRLSPDSQWQHDPGKQHGLPDRQHDHGIRGNRRMLLALPGLR